MRTLYNANDDNAKPVFSAFPDFGGQIPAFRGPDNPPTTVQVMGNPPRNGRIPNSRAITASFTGPRCKRRNNPSPSPRRPPRLPHFAEGTTASVALVYAIPVS